jgi:DNA-binding response OmpR family regulator
VELGSLAALSNIKVLVVEDEYLIASDYARELRRHGAIVIGPVPDVVQARAFLKGGDVDCVLLDLNIKGELAFDFATELTTAGISTLLTSGYDSSLIPRQLRRIAFLQKPVDSRQLVRAIQDQVRSRQ